MRLFVAIDLDDAARDAIAAEQRRLRALTADGSPLRWVRPEHMHLTIVFLGEVDESRAPGVVDALKRPIDVPPFEIVLAGLGVFPPRGAPRALWVGAAEGEAGLRAMQSELARRVGALGVPFEERPFSPHLTLARWKASRPSDRGRVLAAAAGKPLARVGIDHATLYQSHLSSAGATYTALARANLTGTHGPSSSQSTEGRPR